MIRKAISLVFIILVIIWVLFNEVVEGFNHGNYNNNNEVSSGGMKPSMVKREQRKSLMATEYGYISGVDIYSGRKGDYHLEFMTLEPNALFLPVLLHADMVFYVDTGSGKLTWADAGKERMTVDIRRGDVYRLPSGSVFFIQSNLEPERQKLRIYSIFSNTEEHLYESFIGAYSSIRDLVIGFDRELLESAFKASKDVIEEMTSAPRPPAIVHAMPEEKKSIFKEMEDRFLNVGGGGGDRDDDGFFYAINGGKKKKSKNKVFNILKADPDFKNCHGWSLTVRRHDMKSLKGSNIGIFMVNLTKGSMMGPHWNPMATEIAVVLAGQGMVRVVCSSNANETDCKNMRFKVEEGDVFTVPRLHPMAQISFNNDSFVFMGFSTSTRKNYPQFLAGKSSVLQTLNRDVLALSFSVDNTTIHELLSRQEEAIILDCTSCAEGEEGKMVKEMEEEKARKSKEEEEREREEEEERRKKEEEERKREEEEEGRREEEARQEEERRRREEAAKRKQEEEAEERRRREKEAEERQEEERRRREEEEEAKRKQEEEEEERRRREKEAEERQEEERRRREEEEAKRKQEEEEERRRREKEAEERQEEERRRREEQVEREQEEARRQEEERKKKQRQEEEEEERGEIGIKAPRKIWGWKL